MSTILTCFILASLLTLVVVGLVHLAEIIIEIKEARKIMLRARLNAIEDEIYI